MSVKVIYLKIWRAGLVKLWNACLFIYWGN